MYMLVVTATRVCACWGCDVFTATSIGFLVDLLTVVPMIATPPF